MISYMSFVAIMVCLTVTRRANEDAGKGFSVTLWIAVERTKHVSIEAYVCVLMCKFLKPDFKGVMGGQVCIPRERTVQCS